MKSNSKTISELMDEELLRESSITSNFRLGKELYESKNVEITEFTGAKVSAIVHGGTSRKVELILNKDFLNWKCTCRLNQDKYCKHTVAVGLEIINKK
ncbi:MAG: hypothetical protein EPN82_16955 [Bacteroidetes bacterium]|nr:MAG: hypothetical protein EPN82_16955 [Bacteroidota bacterium]